MRKNSFVFKLVTGVIIVAGTPFAVTAMLKNPPDMNVVMAAAVNFSGTEFFEREEIDEIGNGNYILYTPKPKPAETEATTVPPEQPPEVTEIAEEPVETTPQNMLISQNISAQREDLSVFSAQSGKVCAITYTANGGSNFLNLPSGAQVRNCTDLDNDFVKAEMDKKPDIAIELNSDEPQVLIMHTHTSESYLLDGEFYDSSYTCRTPDASQSVVAVGERISEKLATAGICTIHDGTIHDNPLYNGSYDRAETTITKILARYPSIKVILDIHRDAIEQEDGTWVSAVNEINGKEAAQVMIISAAGGGYYYVPNYLENFHFACALQNQMEADNKGITRPVLLDYCQYNQHISTGSLLIEVGSHGNTLEQALYTGELIGESIAKALIALS